VCVCVSESCLKMGGRKGGALFLLLLHFTYHQRGRAVEEGAGGCLGFFAFSRLIYFAIVGSTLPL